MRYDVEVTNSGSAVKDVWVSEARIEKLRRKSAPNKFGFKCI